MEIEANLRYSLATNIYFDKLKESSDLNIFPECFYGPLQTLSRVAFGPRAAICPPLC